MFAFYSHAIARRFFHFLPYLPGYGLPLSPSLAIASLGDAGYSQCPGELHFL